MEAILQWDGQALLFIQEHIRQVWMDGSGRRSHIWGCRMVLDYLGIVLLIPKRQEKQELPLWRRWRSEH